MKKSFRYTSCTKGFECVYGIGTKGFYKGRVVQFEHDIERDLYQEINDDGCRYPWITLAKVAEVYSIEC